MGRIEKAFGFYPDPIEIDAGAVRIRPLAEFDEAVGEVLSSEQVDDGWIYVPPKQTCDFISGEVRERPFSARVFGLRKTHMLEHAKATGDEHVAFHLWSLSFFLGMRMTAMERGFLDATPVKSGQLVDFALLGRSLERAIELAEEFWLGNRGEPAHARQFGAAVHALFLGQYPQALQFERFIHLYTAIDACYALTKALRCPNARHLHGERIGWMCGELGVATPAWALRRVGNSGTVVSALRNAAVHEALFAGEPLGFAVHGTGTDENITLEMEALVCRFLVALIGGTDRSYLGSAVDGRQIHGLRLS